MELSWNDRRTRQFLTNVGLITTDGPYGPNVMAAEWTHHLSYSPSLIAINVRGDDATAENIDHSKEFGVNLAADDQNILWKQEEIGDHVMFIGEVAEISADEKIKPLVYHNGKYWRLDDNNKIPRPSQELIDKIEQITKKYVKE